MCTTSWVTRDEFLCDDSLELNGYQVDFENLYMGLFYFTHIINGCHTTMALRVESFLDLHPGPRHDHLDTDGDKCPGYCHSVEELGVCKNECQGAYIRDIIEIVKSKLGMVARAA